MHAVGDNAEIYLCADCCFCLEVSGNFDSMKECESSVAECDGICFGTGCAVGDVMKIWNGNCVEGV